MPVGPILLYISVLNRSAVCRDTVQICYCHASWFRRLCWEFYVIRPVLAHYCVLVGDARVNGITHARLKERQTCNILQILQQNTRERFTLSE